MSDLLRGQGTKFRNCKSVNKVRCHILLFLIHTLCIFHITGRALDGVDTGEPNAKSYVQLALFHMKANRLDAGLYYIEIALTIEPESLVSGTLSEFF